jgi:UDP-N-acetylglucosamine:LPS N-acetylglucosamine transferase
MGGVTGRRTVLFATIAAGGGHVATAEAMAEALERFHGDAFESRVSDVMAEVGPVWLDRSHKASWKRMLGRPRWIRGSQRVMDRMPRPTHAWHGVMLDRFARRAAEAIDASDPALVVANHGWLATGLSRARRRYGMRAPLVVYETEPFDASALWFAPHAERYVAPSIAAKAALTTLGVADDRVDVLGYPVREGFLTAPDRDEARHDLGLDGRFTCLLSLGAEGVSDRALAIARAIAEEGHAVLAVAGRNRELEDAFRALAGTFPGVRPIGFSREMPKMLAACDVVIGKAGPASVMESLAVGRPLVVTGYAGLNEEAVLRFLLRRGLGTYAPDGASLRAALAAWSSSPGRRIDAARACEDLAFPEMRRAIAAALAGYARRGTGTASTEPVPGGIAAVTPEDLAEPGVRLAAGRGATA